MDARVKIVGVVQIVTVVLLLLTGHGEPAQCSSDPSCEGKAFFFLQFCKSNYTLESTHVVSMYYTKRKTRSSR